MAFDALALRARTMKPEAVETRFLNDDDRKGFSEVRSDAFRLSLQKRASNAATSPARMECLRTSFRRTPATAT